MSTRSTDALDPETASLISELAAAWGVSQAEVVRRSVRLAADTAKPAAPTPAEVVAHYRTHPAPRDWAETERLIADLREQRHQDDIARTGWHE